MNAVEKYIELDKKVKDLKNENELRSNIYHYLDAKFYIFVFVSFLIYAVIYTITQCYSFEFLSQYMYKEIIENVMDFFAGVLIGLIHLTIAFIQSCIFIFLMRKKLEKKYNHKAINYYFYKNVTFSVALFAVILPLVFLIEMTDKIPLINSKKSKYKDLKESEKTDSELIEEIELIENEMNKLIEQISINKNEINYLQENLKNKNNYQSLYEKINENLKKSFLSNNKDFVQYQLEKMNITTIKNE